MHALKTCCWQVAWESGKSFVWICKQCNIHLNQSVLKICGDTWYIMYWFLIYIRYIHIIFYDFHQLVFCSRSGGHKTKWVGVGGAAGRLIGFWLFFRFLETTFDFGFYCSDIGNLKDIGNESGLRAHFGICLNNSVPLWWYLLVLFHSVQNFKPVFSKSRRRGT